MSNSNAIKALVALATCWGASAFVAPVHLGKTLSAPSAPPTQNARQAVAPLNAVSFSRIADSIISDFGSEVGETETCLPQDPNADQDARKEQLEATKKEYEWDTTGIPVGTPFLKGYPPDQEFPKKGWLAKTAAHAFLILTGTVRGAIHFREVVEAFASPVAARTFADKVSTLLQETYGLVRAEDITDYEDLHKFPILNPDTQFDWDDDDTFCRLRLQGANCVMIKKASAETRTKLKILDTDPAYAALKTNVDNLLAADKLFVVDHELLADANTSMVLDWNKYLAPGIALFEVIEDELMPMKPIGIQLSQGQTATPIFVPEDGNNWKIAKACFESTDFSIHEVVSHLGNTHIVMEGAMVAMHRTLPTVHPMYALLFPHTEGTAFINFYAQDLLIVEGGTVDKLTANDIQSSWDMCLEQTLVRIKSDFSPEADFENREVTTSDFPGRYMYRDVGTQYWEATLTWVKSYMDLYYDTDADVDNDYEMQAFITEMTDIAQMKWLDEYEDSQDKKGLIAKVFASLIYTASTLHAAVNFPQKPSMSFVPSCPGAAYAPIPTDKSPRTDEDCMSYLVPMQIALAHVSVLTLLGSVHHTTLGDYRFNNFDDDRVTVEGGPLQEFQEKLVQIEDDLTTTNEYLSRHWRFREKTRRQAKNFEYKVLLPSKVPQSINI